jgi:hypothetical protein
MVLVTRFSGLQEEEEEGNPEMRRPWWSVCV